MIRAAEEVLKRPDTSIQLRTVREPKVTAHATWHRTSGQATQIRIVIDPAQGGIIECALHEALHIVIEEAGIKLGALEEVAVKAIEQDLWVKGFKRATTTRWRRLLNAKISSG